MAIKNGSSSKVGADYKKVGKSFFHFQNKCYRWQRLSGNCLILCEIPERAED